MIAMISSIRAHLFTTLTHYYLSFFEIKSDLDFSPAIFHNFNNTEYTVSVIMSVGPNISADELLECCSSLNKQDNKDFCLLLFFDGKDYHQFLECINMFDYPICVFSSNVNLGLGVALNFLTRRSLQIGAKYIVRSDADDYSSYTRINTLISYLDAHNKIDFVGSSYQIVSNIPALCDKIRRFPGTSQEAYRRSALTPIVAHATVAFRSQLFAGKLIYLDDKRIGIEDQLLWLQARLSHLSFSNLDIPLYFVRVNQSFFRRRLYPRKTFNLFLIRILHALHPASSIYYSIVGVAASALRLIVSIVSIPFNMFN